MGTSRPMALPTFHAQPSAGLDRGFGGGVVTIWSPRAAWNLERGGWTCRPDPASQHSHPGQDLSLSFGPPSAPQAHPATGGRALTKLTSLSFPLSRTAASFRQDQDLIYE